jgi:hypothetical protein
MRGVLWVRVGGVLTALFAASFLTVPSFPKSIPWDSGSPPSVDRTLKGDRLPAIGRVILPADPASTLGLKSPSQPASVEKIPVGCDAAFSSISRSANVFGRCLA